MGAIFVAVRLIELTTSHQILYELIGGILIFSPYMYMYVQCRVPAAVSLW